MVCDGDPGAGVRKAYYVRASVEISVEVMVGMTNTRKYWRD
jgi:hypothetical protein